MLDLPELKIEDQEADARFRRLAVQGGLNPDDPWVGGYVDYEWTHARYIFEPLIPRGPRVLEFGCNVGATSVVLARLGADVTGVDVNAWCVELARANAGRYGVRADFLHLEDTRRMPFETASFDLVSSNSVLEYVPRHMLGEVQREIDRVLKPEGLVVVTGTSSRLWPKEVHSRRWSNWIPRSWAPALQRGISPWQVRSGFVRYEDLGVSDRGRWLIEAKRQMGFPVWSCRLMRLAGTALAPLGVSAGMLTPSIALLLRKK